MNKKKKIIIGSLIGLGILIVVGILLYIFTDFLKTKEQLFWKYFVIQKDDVASVFVNDGVKQFNKEEKKSAYTKEGNLTVNTEFNIIKPIDVKIIEKGNNNENIKNIYMELKYDDKSYGNATLIRDNDYYLIQSNLIGNDYLGFENNNFKELAKEFGISNTDYIPNRINEIDFSELFSFTELECLHLQNKYLPIYKKHIKNSDYIKRNNVKLDKYKDNITSYELQLSEKQFKEFILDVLETASEDEGTLIIINKKLNTLSPDSEYANKEFIKEKLGKLIEYLSNKEATDKKFLSIIIYKNKNNVIKTEIKVSNDRIFSIEKIERENKIVFKQYGIKDKQIDLSSIEGIVRTVIDSLGEITYKKNIVGNNTSNVEITAVFNIGIEKITINYNYVEKLESYIDGLVYKKDVEFLELKEYGKKIMQNLIKENRLDLLPDSLKNQIFETDKK